jgi:hypothetical protein
MEIRLDLDTTKIAGRLSKDIELSQKRLDAQVMKDSNYYCPMDTGALQKSVLGSVIGSGRLVWDIEYARKMYHFKGNLSKDENPNASTKWFERAKMNKLKEWEKVAAI